MKFYPFIRNLLLGSIALLVLPLVSSCVEDNMPPCKQENSDSYRQPQFSLLIPVGNTSRADAALDTNDDEAISELDLYIFKTDDDATLQEHIDLKDREPEEVEIDGKNYRKYELTERVPEGSYYFIVTANLSTYLKSAIPPDASLKKADVEAAVMAFKTSRLPEAGNLPMACLAKEIKGANSDGVFSLVRSKINEVYADLTILCAKVRFTILFDRTQTEPKGFSSKFSKPVDFSSSVSVTNIMAETKLVGTTSTEGKFQSTATLNKVLYPTDPNSAYLGGPGTPKYEDNLTKIDGTNSNWLNPETQRAWQGIIYLPENLSTEHTTLHFTPYDSPELKATGYDFILNSHLQRGNFYDCIAHVETPDKLEVTIKIGLNKWIYEDYTQSW